MAFPGEEDISAFQVPMHNVGIMKRFQTTVTHSLIPLSHMYQGTPDISLREWLAAVLEHLGDPFL